MNSPSRSPTEAQAEIARHRKVTSENAPGSVTQAIAGWPIMPNSISPPLNIGAMKRTGIDMYHVAVTGQSPRNSWRLIADIKYDR